MAYSTLDDIVAALSRQQVRSITLPSVTTVAGQRTDLNGAGSGRWGQMATPAAASSSGTLHAAGDAGFNPITAPGGGRELHLMGGDFAQGQVAKIMVYERIWSCSGLSGTSTSAQTITSFPALTIPDSVGTGLEMFAEVFTQIGTTLTTVTASYTNSGNTSGRTTVAASIGGTGLREVYRLIPMYLQSGDTGVKSITSATLAGTTGTAGNWGLVLARYLTSFNVGVVWQGKRANFLDVGLPKIDSGAALMFVQLATTTTSGVVDGSILIGEN